MEIEPFEQDRIDGDVIALKCRFEVALRVELDRAIERVKIIDRLDLDEGGRLASLRHGAQAGDLGDGAFAGEKGQFGLCRLAMDEGHFDIAAEQRLALFDQTAIDGRTERADNGDGSGAERQTGEEDPEALQARAQVTPGIDEPEVRTHDGRPKRYGRP